MAFSQEALKMAPMYQEATQALNNADPQGVGQIVANITSEFQTEQTLAQTINTYCLTTA